MTAMPPVSPIQQSLLHYLRQNSGRTVTRDELALNVWKFRLDPRSRVIDQTVSLVRKGLMSGERIVAVFGLGYRLDPSVSTNGEGPEARAPRSIHAASKFCPSRGS